MLKEETILNNNLKNNPSYLNAFTKIAYYMDIYTICRIFKNYTKYIILYVGVYHGERIARFLQEWINKYGGSSIYNEEYLKSIKKQNIKMNTCVDVSNMDVLRFETAPEIKDKYFEQDKHKAFIENDFNILDKAYYKYYSDNNNDNYNDNNYTGL